MGLYEAFSFSTAIAVLERYVQEDLSAFYLDVIKNRLYLPPRSDPLRQSVIATLQSICVDLLALTRPIAPYLAAEVAEHYEQQDDPSPLKHPSSSNRDEEGLQATWAGLRTARSQTHQFIQTLISQG